MGHRNPQGLYYSKKFDFILSTEHGPKGGDEININNKPFLKVKKILDGQFHLMENIIKKIIQTKY